MLRNILFVLICLHFSAPALGAKYRYRSNIKEIAFHFGTHTEGYNTVQTDDSGGLRKFELSPVIGIGANLPMFSGLGFFPEFNWVLPHFIEESRIYVNTFMYRFDFGYDVVDWFRFRLGTSIIHLNQHGRGGSTSKDNGNGSSTFYYPDENRSSYNNTLDVGAEFIYDQFAFRVQTYTYSIFREERRQLAYTLFLTYYWENQ